jgi:hypothetical protein
MSNRYEDITNLRITEALSAEFLLLLSDRGSLSNHPAIVFAGDAAASGSKTVRLSHIGLMGYDRLASTADGVATTSTDFTNASTNISVGRYAKNYSITDLASATASNGLIDPASLAADAVASYNTTLSDLIAALMGGFTNTVTATTTLTVANVLSAISQLEQENAQGPYMMVLHPKQYGDLRSDIATASAGAVQWAESSQQQLIQMGSNYKGKFLGVDVFVSSAVPVTGGTDYTGAVFARGAVAFADMSVNEPDAINIGGKVLFERDRTAASGTTAYVSSAFLGVSECIDDAGVTIISDI